MVCSPHFILVVLLPLCPAILRAGCCEIQTPGQSYHFARASGEYRVASAEFYRGPHHKIRTAYRLVLTAALKGDAPQVVEWNVAGGMMEGEFESSSLHPGWEPGEEYMIHLQRDDDGRWEPMSFRSMRNAGSPEERKALRDFIKRGATGTMPRQIRSSRSVSADANSGIPGSRVTATGYFESSGVPNRFTTCDTGAAIPCIVDIDATKLPAGVNAAGALQIVRNALGAWSAASSVKFTIETTTSFGVGADTISTQDGKLRIQLHDTYNRISSTGTLGIGGGGWSIDPGAGATIVGRSFNRRSQSYVVLNHRAASMANQTSYAEVLTHEIGHALGLAHSSESATESEPMLKNATMYYMARADGRGASIKDYDKNRIAYGYPFDTPPVALNRTLRVITGSPQPTGFGVDRVRLNLFDLQTAPSSLTASLTAPASGFSLSGSTLIYVPPAVYGDALLTSAEIENGYYYAKASFQVSDGVNLSAKADFIITGYHRDSTPGDGLPDSWMMTYFGSTAMGAAGSPRHPDSDPDGDRLSNRNERYLGTNPLDAASGLPKVTFRLGQLSFTPIRCVPYEIESSSDLVTWTKRNQFTTFTAPALVPIDLTEPAGTKAMMYRIKIAP